jgi:hypothetical protein
LHVRGHAAGLKDSELRDYVTSPNNLERIAKPKRADDTGNGLWEVLNRIQENTIRGAGTLYYGADGKYHQVKGLTAIGPSLKANQALWNYADKLAA